MAYIGSDANEYLKMQTGDMLIFDGDDRTIQRNLINVESLRRLRKLGVDLRSCPGLHSKIMVVESRTPFALVGSANASKSSVEDKLETVAVFDDKKAVQEVREAIAAYELRSKPVDAEWLKRAAKLPRDKRTTGSKAETGILADPQATLWITDWVADNQKLSNSERHSIDNARQTVAVVEQIRVQPKDDAWLKQIAKGDSLLVVAMGETSNKPRSNSRVYEPAKIVDIVPRSKGGLIVLGYRQGSESRPWQEVEAAITAHGDDWDSDRLSDAARDDLWALFS